MLTSDCTQTPLTDLLKIEHPIMLAGMSQAAGPDLVCAVSKYSVLAFSLLYYADCNVAALAA